MVLREKSNAPPARWRRRGVGTLPRLIEDELRVSSGRSRCTMFCRAPISSSRSAPFVERRRARRTGDRRDRRRDGPGETRLSHAGLAIRERDHRGPFKVRERAGPKNKSRASDGRLDAPVASRRSFFRRERTGNDGKTSGRDSQGAQTTHFGSRRQVGNSLSLPALRM